VAMGVRGSPTLQVSDGWTYGPASGVATSTTADERALVIAAGSALKVDVAGGTAVFAEKVSGEGALVVTNGAVRLDGGLAGETTLKVAANGAYAVSGVQALDGSLAGDGGALDFSLPATLALGGTADLTGLTFRFEGPTDGWLTLVTSPNPIAGSPVLPENWRSRVVLAEGTYRYQAKPIPGFSLIIR